MHFLHPEFARYAQALMDLTEYARDNNCSPEQLDEIVSESSDWSEAFAWAMSVLMNNRVTGLAGSAFGVPFLNPDICAKFVTEAVRLGDEYGHTPNPDEEPAYQIPEIVLKHVAPDIHEKVSDLVQYLNIWFMLIYQTTPKSISSIQFAKYEPDGTGNGNWHIDEDSDFTAVVSLAPEMFEGGGTDIMVSPVEYMSVPPLPAGYALLMNGKQIRHRGRQVTSGVRHLLVFWLDSLDDSDDVGVCESQTE